MSLHRNNSPSAPNDHHWSVAIVVTKGMMCTQANVDSFLDLYGGSIVQFNIDPSTTTQCSERLFGDRSRKEVLTWINVQTLNFADFIVKNLDFHEDYTKLVAIKLCSKGWFTNRQTSEGVSWTFNRAELFFRSMG